MKRWLRFRWWAALLVAMGFVGALLFLRLTTGNVMHPALDELASVKLQDRWSHPQMLKIRELGPKAIPPLRRVLREKNNPATQLLLWVRKKWPAVTKYYSRFPNPERLSARYWTACQVLQSLGPAAKAATPELVENLRGNDISELNGTTMALFAIGIDADVCEQMDTLMQKGQITSPSARSQIVRALARVKPPAERTLKVLIVALTDPSPWVQYAAAEALASLSVRTPEVVSALKRLQSTTTDDLTVVTSSAALWELEHDASIVRAPVFRVLESLVHNSVATWPGGGSGGQGVTAADQSFMAAAGLFPKMSLSDADRANALELLKSWGDKSERIFIRMLLLPAMMELGLAHEQSVAICQEGLARSEDYYRIQAARLLVVVNEQRAVDDRYVEALLRHQDVAVRVYAAKIHWRQNRVAATVVPVLIEALNQSKYQSYYYPEAQSAALITLGDIGPEAREAIAALENIASDPNPNVAKQASEAMAKIRK